jgi:hypothetical protein
LFSIRLKVQANKIQNLPFFCSQLELLNNLCASLANLKTVAMKDLLLLSFSLQFDFSLHNLYERGIA